MDNIIFICFVVILILAILIMNLDNGMGWSRGPIPYTKSGLGSRYREGFVDETQADSGSSASNIISGSSDTVILNDAPTTIPSMYDETTAPFMYDATTAPSMYDATTAPSMYDATTVPPMYDATTSAPIETTTPSATFTPSGSEETTTPGVTSGPPEDCKYSWSDWGKCSINTGMVTRSYATTPPSNGGAECTTPPALTSTQIDCMKALTFYLNSNKQLPGWTQGFLPEAVRQMKNTFSVYDASAGHADSWGFASPGSLFNTNYARVAFDNLDGAYADVQENVEIVLQTSIPNLDVGNYLMTYYVQSNNDNQCVSISASVNNTQNVAMKFRTVDANGNTVSLIGAKKWVQQKLAFTITPEDYASASAANLQLIFNLFDKQTANVTSVALGGIKLQSCGDTSCNIDCTYILGDWSYCDFTSGKASRGVVTIPPSNQGAACTRPLDTINCFDPLNLPDQDLSKDRWELSYSSADVGSVVKTSVASTEADPTYQFYNTDATFKGPYTIVHVDNRKGALKQVPNGSRAPFALMKTNMLLAPGNYTLTFFVQSWYTAYDDQSFQIRSFFGENQYYGDNTDLINQNTAINWNTFDFKDSTGRQMVMPGVWFPITLEYKVTATTAQPVPIYFQFIFKNTAPGFNNAVALGGMQMVSCGDQPCKHDCLYVWEDWKQPCGDDGNTYRDPIIIQESKNGGAACPARDVSTCSVLPVACQYSWGDWSTCNPGDKTRTRTQITVPPRNRGLPCTDALTETANDCNIACEYQGWESWPTCVAGSISRSRNPITSAPKNGGATCTPGVQTRDDCEINCKSSLVPGSEVCDGSLQLLTRTYNVESTALNSLCYVDDICFGHIQLPNEIGNHTVQVGDRGSCNDCTYHQKVSECNQDNGYVKYEVDQYDTDRHSGKKCYYKGIPITQTGVYESKDTCEVDCKVSYVDKTERCEIGEGKPDRGRQYRTYKVEKESINKKGACTHVDATKNNVSVNLDNVKLYKTKELDVGTCPAPCSYNASGASCSADGYHTYNISNYQAAKNGGACEWNPKEGFANRGDSFVPATEIMGIGSSYIGSSNMILPKNLINK